MTYPRARTDYGLVRVEVLERDGRNVKVKLKEDYPPVGEKGETSWIPRTTLIEE